MGKPALRSTREAPHYVVVRFFQDPDAAAGHDHVIAIETRDPDGGSTTWRATDVIGAIREGERFVADDGRDPESVIEPALCPECPRVTVKVIVAEERPAAS